MLYLIPELYTLVSVIWEGFAWNKSTSALLSMQLSFFIHHLALNQHQHWTSATFQTLEDVVFCSLCREKI